MSRTPPRHRNQRGRTSATRATNDIWREAAPLPDLEPVASATDPTALLRSLGEPPFTGTTDVALHFAIVIERAAALASGLALSAGLLADAHS
jgi:hypothetical protein